MSENKLILDLPQGILVATSLGVEGLARHRSPGSGKFFKGRSVLFDLATEGGKPGFRFLDEGGWRDAQADAEAALDAVGDGKKTKTALSNNAFSCTPVDAFGPGYLVKTGGQAMALDQAAELRRFTSHACDERMTPTQVAEAAGEAPAGARGPHVYAVMCPVGFVVMSSLSPSEYAWYATHRLGKVCRQVCFVELDNEPTHLAAESVFTGAREVLANDPKKKTKTIVIRNCIDRIPFSSWCGYGASARGGLYLGDRDHLMVYRLPTDKPAAWERAAG